MPDTNLRTTDTWHEEADDTDEEDTMMGLETYYAADRMNANLTAIDARAKRRWDLKQARATGQPTAPTVATRARWFAGAALLRIGARLQGAPHPAPRLSTLVGS